MASQGPQWVWDPNRRLYYIYDPTRNAYVYQDGFTIPIVHNDGSQGTVSSSTAALEGHFRNLSVSSGASAPAGQSSLAGDTPRRAHSRVPDFKGVEYKIEGTQGDAEPLDPKYRVRSGGDKFFKLGRVFRILWVEPGGYTTNQNARKNTLYSDRFPSEPIHTKIRWFVVVVSGPDYCLCVPIQTYTGQGIAKGSTVARHHAIIYSGKSEPEPSKMEKNVLKKTRMLRAIRVRPRTRSEKLDPMSRINFGKIYTIEHNVKVYEFGDVIEDDKGLLLQHYQRVRKMLEGGLDTEGNDSDESAPQASHRKRGFAAPSKKTQQQEEESEEESEDDEDDDGHNTTPTSHAQTATAAHNSLVNYYVAYWRATGDPQDQSRADYLQNAPLVKQVEYLASVGAYNR